MMVSGPGGLALIYDPVGRLDTVTRGGTTRFQYDGLAMIGEHSSAGAVLNRYVHAPGIDTPLVWYAGAGLTDRRFLMSDERGSIVSVANDSGSVIAVNAFDEFGIPGAGNMGRFQYTGQVWLPEAGLYYYKARMYSPSLGRFMQTDPIGYADGMNWYNYVGGERRRGCVAKGRVRSLAVLILDPGRDPDPGMSKGEEQRLVQQLAARPAVKALTEAVLHRLARRDVTPLGEQAPGPAP